MKNYTQFKGMAAACALLFTGLLSSCEQDLAAPTKIVDHDASKARAVYSQRWVDFNNRADGTYEWWKANEDFGNQNGWNDSRAYISTNRLRVTLLANQLSANGGMVAGVDIVDGTAYELDFDVMFHSNFTWGRGGKVGFGFGFGYGKGGCQQNWDGYGASQRVMWYTDDAGRTYFRPYLYHMEQPTNCGDHFNMSWPSSGSLSKGTWYRIHMYVVSNNYGNKDGYAEIKVNNNAWLGRSTKWTTNHDQRYIKDLWFHTFRGGSESYWATSTQDYIYYDNIWINKIN